MRVAAGVTVTVLMATKATAMMKRAQTRTEHVDELLGAATVMAVMNDDFSSDAGSDDGNAEVDDDGDYA